MSSQIECDVWVRGTQQATTHRIANLPARPSDWTEDDVRRLLGEMLLALERETNPGGEVPSVTLRGFNWIVSPYDQGGALVHVELHIGTASAGPIDVPVEEFTSLIQRALVTSSSPRVH